MVRVSSPAKLRPWSELTAKMVMGGGSWVGQSCKKSNRKEKDNDHDQDFLAKDALHIWSWSSDVRRRKTVTMAKIPLRKAWYVYGHGPLIFFSSEPIFFFGISRKIIKVARLQSEFGTKDFFEPRIFLRKMLRYFRPEIFEPLFCGSEKSPENSLQISH